MIPIELSGVTRLFQRGSSEVKALNGVSLSLEAGTSCAVIGPSGSGKSTLLHICGALDKPSSGHVKVLGTDLTHSADHTLTRFRRYHIGFVFN